MKRTIISVASGFLLLSLFTATAQNPEDPGPDKAAWRTMSLANRYPGSTTISCLVAYPGQTSGENAALSLLKAPYPVIVFGHGFTSTGHDMMQVAKHFASWGFFFVAHDTWRLGPQTEQLKDMEALTRILRDENRRSGSFFYNAVDENRFAVAGHSMGGGSAAGVLGSSADVQAGVLLAPWVGILPDASNWMKTARAPYLVLVGQGDIIAPGSANATKFYKKGDSVQRYRGLTWLWKGCDHFSVVRTTSASTPDHIEAFRLCRRQMTSFLLAHLKDRHAYLDVLVGKATHAEVKFDEVRYEVRDPDLYLTGTVQVGGTLEAHVMGKDSSPTLTYVSPVPAALPLPGLGVLGLHPMFMVPLGAGTIVSQQVEHAVYPIPAEAGLAGLRIHIQALALDAGSAYGLTPTRDFRITATP